MQGSLDMAGPMDASRRLVLKLHTLHEEDRAWLLGQLPQEERIELQALLNELSELGIQLEPEDIEQIYSQPVAKTQAELEADAADIQVINRATLSQIDIVFDGEPAVLMHHLLAMYPWTWKGDWQERRREMGLSPDTKAVQPTQAVQRALLKAVAEQLRSQELLFEQPSLVSTQQSLQANGSEWKRFLPWAQ
ncbi:hypothetical protein ACW4YW_15315 [Methylobacillus pratensis]